MLTLSLSLALLAAPAAQAQALELGQLAPGQRGELSLILLEAPAREWPLSVRIEAKLGERPSPFVEDRLDWDAVVDPLAVQPRLRTSFVAPSEPGHYEVHATISYGVCGPKWCQSKRGELHWTLEVVAPSP